MSDAPDVSLYMSTHLGDRLRETGDLSPAEYGSHIRLCEASWVRGGALPAEPARLCRLAGAAPGDWPSIWAAISPLWTTHQNGTISHAPTLAQIDRARAARASVSERGRKGREAQLATKPAQAEPGNGLTELRIASRSGSSAGFVPAHPSTRLSAKHDSDLSRLS